MIRKYFRLKHFAKWVEDYVFSDICEDDVFVKLACRKLKDLGLVKLINVWNDEGDHAEYYEGKNGDDIEDFSSTWFFYGVWIGIAICGVCVYFFG